MEIVPLDNWFPSLVSDCKQIIEEARKTAGLVLIRAKYDLGKRIIPDYIKFDREHSQILLADSLEVSRTTVGNCINFAKKVDAEYGSFDNYLQDVNALTHSWRSITIEWLPVKPRFEPVDSPPLPLDLFNVIYADPPWRYEFGRGNRAIEAHYSTMPLEDIKDLKVPSTDDSILFLWATSPKLEEALSVLNAWGFTYRTSMVWVKPHIGMGYWVRSKHEFLLIGKKGDMRTPLEADRPPSTFTAPRLGHSEKPNLVYDLIENMFPNGKYLELFARNEREGWTSWGA